MTHLGRWIAKNAGRCRAGAELCAGVAQGHETRIVGWGEGACDGGGKQPMQERGSGGIDLLGRKPHGDEAAVLQVEESTTRNWDAR
jgi:hypothetical protein